MSQCVGPRGLGFISMFGIRGVGECECAGVRVGECGRGSGWEGGSTRRRVCCIGCGRVDGSTHVCGFSCMRNHSPGNDTRDGKHFAE